MKTVRIIAVCGAAKAGKSTVAKHLETHGYKRERFAGRLKQMLHLLGLSWDELDGNLKEVPSPLLGGKTPRHAMQTLGTEWRDMIDPLLWTNVLERELRILIAAAPENGTVLIVVDDLRFAHEAAMLQRIGGEVWKVRRAAAEPGIVTRWLSGLPKVFRVFARLLGYNVLHRSELSWQTIEADIEIFNNHSEGDLRAAIDAILQDRSATSAA